jgi:hypothetical protein
VNTEITTIDATTGEEVPAPTAVAIRPRAPVSTAGWTPTMVISIAAARAAVQARRKFMAKVLVDVKGALVEIPGVTDRPDAKKVLGKSGAETLLNAFGLRAELEDEEPPDIDLTGDLHGGEPFIRYRRRCRVYWQPDTETHLCVAQASGSCSSWEVKYRYRQSERVCPLCSKPAIIKGREEYGGGWICFAKKGGCGAKFGKDDSAIVGQTVGRVSNPDVADAENTILKMADKRALVAATIIATAWSDLVTQDLEDRAAPPAEEDAPPAPSPPAHRTAPTSTGRSAAPATPATAPVLTPDRGEIIAKGVCAECQRRLLTSKHGNPVIWATPADGGPAVCTGWDPVVINPAGTTGAYVMHPKEAAPVPATPLPLAAARRDPGDVDPDEVPF